MLVAGCAGGVYGCVGAGGAGITSMPGFGGAGSTAHATKYAITPGTIPLKNAIKHHTKRTIVGSTSRYSARPPQTPPSFWSVERIRRFWTYGVAGALGWRAPQ